MQLPFTTEQFYAVFRDYNTALWPAQVFLLALAAAAIALVVWPRRWSGAGVSVILALLWGWMALAYHLAFFTSISVSAYGFAMAFLAASSLFFWHGVVRRKLEFRLTTGARSATGVLLVMFALIVYPAWSSFSGHPYLETPSFGLPCPTTMFTAGLLAFLVRPYPRSPLVVPVLWSLVGVQAAWLLSVPQDLGLAVVAVIGIVLIATARSTIGRAGVLSSARRDQGANS
jgi:Family of unknown function (DUF6064)